LAHYLGNVQSAPILLDGAHISPEVRQACAQALVFKPYALVPQRPKDAENEVAPVLLRFPSTHREVKMWSVHQRYYLPIE
jgi:hypothetical protein